MSEIRSIPIADIKVGERHRVDFGDMQALASSVRDRGQLYPILVTETLRLLDGARRMRALAEIGETYVNVIVQPDIETLSAELRRRTELEIERDANLHKEFNRLEKDAIRRELEPYYREEAKRRQREGQSRGGSAPRGEVSETVSESSADRRASKALEEIGLDVNASAPELRRIRAVVDNGAPELVERLIDDAISTRVLALVATLPKEEQSKVVAEGDAAIKKAAKEVRAKREPGEKKPVKSKAESKIVTLLNELHGILGKYNNEFSITEVRRLFGELRTLVLERIER